MTQAGSPGSPAFPIADVSPGRRVPRGLERVLDAAELQHLGENCTDPRREGRIGAQCPPSRIRSSRSALREITRFGCFRSGRRRAGKPFLASCLLEAAFPRRPNPAVSRLFGGGRVPGASARRRARRGRGCAKEGPEPMFHVKHLDRAGGVGGARLGVRCSARCGGRRTPRVPPCAADAAGGPRRGGRAGGSSCAEDGPAHAAGEGSGPRASAGCVAMRWKISRGLQIRLNRVQFPFC